MGYYKNMATVSRRSVREVQQYLAEYTNEVTGRKEKQQVAAAGAQKVKQEAAKAPTPRSKRVHYYYPKKAARIAIKPGNLRRSMKVYRTREGGAEVGPKFIRSVVGMTELGQNAKTASGYYAAALYGSAASFRQQILEPALTRSAGKAAAAMEKKFEQIHKKAVR